MITIQQIIETVTTFFAAGFDIGASAPFQALLTLLWLLLGF